VLSRLATQVISNFLAFIKICFDQFEVVFDSKCSVFSRVSAERIILAHVLIKNTQWSRNGPSPNLSQGICCKYTNTHNWFKVKL